MAPRDEVYAILRSNPALLAEVGDQVNAGFQEPYAGFLFKMDDLTGFMEYWDLTVYDMIDFASAGLFKSHNSYFYIDSDMLDNDIIKWGNEYFDNPYDAVQFLVSTNDPITAYTANIDGIVDCALQWTLKGQIDIQTSNDELNQLIVEGAQDL